MSDSGLALISHPLCPFVQRAAIVLLEKGVSFDRIDVDLAAKPEWFLALSPTGKVPLLKVDQADGSATVLFEQAKNTSGHQNHKWNTSGTQVDIHWNTSGNTRGTQVDIHKKTQVEKTQVDIHKNENTSGHPQKPKHKWTSRKTQVDIGKHKWTSKTQVDIHKKNTSENTSGHPQKQEKNTS